MYLRGSKGQCGQRIMREEPGPRGGQSEIMESFGGQGNELRKWWESSGEADLIYYFKMYFWCPPTLLVLFEFFLCLLSFLLCVRGCSPGPTPFSSSRRAHLSLFQPWLLLEGSPPDLCPCRIFGLQMACLLSIQLSSLSFKPRLLNLKKSSLLKQPLFQLPDAGYHTTILPGNPALDMCFHNCSISLFSVVDQSSKCVDGHGCLFFLLCQYPNLSLDFCL